MRNSNLNRDILVICEIHRVGHRLRGNVAGIRRRQVLHEADRSCGVREVVEEEVAEFRARSGEEGEDGLPWSFSTCGWVVEEADVAELDAGQMV